MKKLNIVVKILTILVDYLKDIKCRSSCCQCGNTLDIDVNNEEVVENKPKVLISSV
jgi:hypothetical protein